MAENTKNTEQWATRRVLLIDYNNYGRYTESLFTRTVPDNDADDSSPVYISTAGMKFNETLLNGSNACPVPDGDTLYRYVLKDGTIITSSSGSPCGCGIGRTISTYDGRSMFVPIANIAYVVENV